MNMFLISLSRLWIHGSGSIRILEGVLELSTSCLGWKRELVLFFAEADKGDVDDWSLYLLIVDSFMIWRLIKDFKSDIMFSACFAYDIDACYI